MTPLLNPKTTTSDLSKYKPEYQEMNEEYFADLELEDDFDTCNYCYRLRNKPPTKQIFFWDEILD